MTQHWAAGRERIRTQTHVVQEIPSLPSEEIAVHRRECAAHVCPLRAAVVRQRGVSVLEEDDHHYPVRHREPGDAVDPEERAGAQARVECVECVECCREADVGDEYRESLVGLEEDRVCCVVI